MKRADNADRFAATRSDMPIPAVASSLLFPDNVLSAAAHPDPYRYYAALLAYRPIYRDHRLGLWVALGADRVTAVLGSELCRVRPPAEPVPAAIAGAPSGEVFRHLVRMNDGPRHAAAKGAVSACLAAFDQTRLTAVARRNAASLVRDLAADQARGIDALAATLPVRVMAEMIGLPDAAAAECAPLIGDFVRCLSPLSGLADIRRSNQAAARLLAVLRAELHQGRHGGTAMIAERLQDLGIDEPDAVIANLIGFMSQAYEATAGLIGNTLLALARDADLRRRAAGDDALLAWVIEEVARHDPPIHNTRRYVAQDGLVAGQAMQAGDQILVLLAAANRDPAIHPRPHCFDPDRADRSSFTFGAGPHACAGRAIAVGIAAAGIQALLAHGLDFETLRTPMRYRPSVNARIPQFGGAP